jgi:bifunctional ADP-heptose synthase (sugar kinase/adenylyltransferase)
MKILVIGDSCKDIFRYGKVSRLAPEAPIPIITPTTEEENPGMAGNVVANLEALGAEVDFITNKKEIRKIRYVCSKYNHLLLRIDENDKCERIITDFLPQQEYDAIVISDYCKGFLHEDDIEKISTIFRNTPIFLDTKKILGDWAYNIDFIKINYEEYKNNKSILDTSSFLFKKTIITRGKFGCDFQSKNYPTVDVPVKDISGAGDTFLSGLVTEYIKSSNIKRAIEFAQECTTIVVQKAGVSTI